MPVCVPVRFLVAARQDVSTGIVQSKQGKERFCSAGVAGYFKVSADKAHQFAQAPVSLWKLCVSLLASEAVSTPKSDSPLRG